MPIERIRLPSSYPYTLHWGMDECLGKPGEWVTVYTIAREENPDTFMRRARSFSRALEVHPTLISTSWRQALAGSRVRFRRAGHEVQMRIAPSAAKSWPQFGEVLIPGD